MQIIITCPRLHTYFFCVSLLKSRWLAVGYWCFQISPWQYIGMYVWSNSLNEAVGRAHEKSFDGSSGDTECVSQMYVLDYLNVTIPDRCHLTWYQLYIVSINAQWRPGSWTFEFVFINPQPGSGVWWHLKAACRWSVKNDMDLKRQLACLGISLTAN